MKLRTKLLAGFGSTICLLVLLAAMSSAYAKRTEFFLRQSDLKSRELYDAESVKAAVISELLLLAKSAYTHERASPEVWMRSQDEARAKLRSLKESLNQDNPNAARLSTITTTYREIDRNMNLSLQALQEHRARDAQNFYRTALRVFDEQLSKELSTLVDDETLDTVEVLENMVKSITVLRSRLVFIILGAAALIISLALKFVLTLSRRLESLEEATEKVASGCFEPIAAMEKGRDELSALGTAFNRMSVVLGRRTEQLMDAEAKLITSAKLSALGEMAGGIAHEINTPLCSIKLMSEQMQEMLTEEGMDPALISEMCGAISATATRTGQIIDGLRTFSRDASNDQLTPAPVKEVIDNAISLFTEKLKNSGVQFQYTIPSADLAIRCRQVQISQIILNLVSNSCDAIERLESKWIKVDVETHGNDVLIAVTDSGNGIPETVRKKIFQPFFTTKELGKGTGLGLSISCGIARAHQGDLTVDSSSPHTRFVLRIPRAHSQSAVA